MQIKLTKVYVDEHDKALKFYTDVLGMQKKADYERIKAKGGEFIMPPTDVTASIIAQVDDTCGNIIQFVQLNW